jgi:hypothetical protein
VPRDDEYGDDMAMDYREPAVIAFLDAHWQAVYVIRPQGDDAVVAEVRVELRPHATFPAGGIPARLLKEELRPGRALAFFREAVRETVAQQRESGYGVRILDKRTGQVFRDIVATRSEQWAPWTAALARWAPPPTDPHAAVMYRRAATAALYEAQVEAGERAPNRRVAEIQGRTVEAVRDDLFAARRDGLLTPSTKQGRSGGRITPAARAILEEAQS